MRESITNIMGNFGKSIGLSSPIVKNSEISPKYLNSSISKTILDNKLYEKSPTRPQYLPPPLPYNRKDKLNDLNTVDNLIPSPFKGSFGLIEKSAIESNGNNLKMLRNSSFIRSEPFINNSGNLIKCSNKINGCEDTLDMNIKESIDNNTSQTASVVRIKTIGNTGDLYTNNLLSNSVFSMNITPKHNLDRSNSVFTPLSNRNKPLFLLNTTPSKTKSVIHEEMNSTPILSDRYDVSDTSEILRRRLNEKNQEIHFLRRTINDLELNISNNTNKQKLLNDNDILINRRIKDLNLEKQEYFDKCILLQEELRVLREEFLNLQKENKCLSGNYELKIYEINKLNEELLLTKKLNKNDIIEKYLDPLKDKIKNLLLNIGGEKGRLICENNEDNKIDISIMDDLSQLDPDITSIIESISSCVDFFEIIINEKLSEKEKIEMKLHDEIRYLNNEIENLKLQIMECEESYRCKKDNKEDLNIKHSLDKYNKVKKLIRNNKENKDLSKYRKLLNRGDNRDMNDIKSPLSISSPQRNCVFGLSSLAKSLLGYAISTNNNNFNYLNSNIEKYNSNIQMHDKSEDSSNSDDNDNEDSEDNDDDNKDDDNKDNDNKDNDNKDNNEGDNKDNENMSKDNPFKGLRRSSRLKKIINKSEDLKGSFTNLKDNKELTRESLKIVTGKKVDNENLLVRSTKKLSKLESQVNKDTKMKKSSSIDKTNTKVLENKKSPLEINKKDSELSKLETSRIIIKAKSKKKQTSEKSLDIDNKSSNNINNSNRTKDQSNDQNINSEVLNKRTRSNKK
ncbi:hypothetical protein cand_028090 [Cryptosporidium andersoni]|uniref:Uncharacterized protein n=1 Tax=Cryptosporidium andersoni TaxID=117008 RepID=A0A1J4MR69_9CRYT|nr:hypothetical protein cand_028090 [Cryptosporidium andersoni]